MCYSGFSSRSCCGKAAQLSHTEMETRTEHADYFNLDSLLHGVQHVWSVKLDVWVITKLF